jgi:hypothetical protein
VTGELPACDICGGPNPPELLEQTTVRTIAPLQANLCPICRLIQDHSQPEDRCLECGDVVDTGCYIELEYPAGVEDLPARISGSLCGECAADHAFRINYRGVENDEEASERYTELVEKQSQARRGIRREGS